MRRKRRPTRAPFEDALSRRVTTLRRPLVFAALGAFVLVVAAALAFVWRQYEDAKDAAAHDLRGRAVLAATVFDTYFQGQVEALSAIAAAPAVVSGDVEGMNAYFARFRPGTTSFTAGVGWIDPTGRQRATSDPNGPTRLSLATRSYFKDAMRTKKPVVADAIIAAASKRRLLVIAVPTRDREGRVNGVLAGGFVLQPSANDSRANDLGYTGLHVIDSSGQQVTRRDLARPQNGELVSRLRRAGEGVLVGVDGLDSSSGRVVAFATAKAPGWTVVLDQSAASVFGDARRALLREVVLISAASAFVLLFLVLAARRARRDVAASRAQVERWAGLTRSLNSAADVGEVDAVFLQTLSAEYPDGVSHVVALGRREEPSMSVARGSRAPDRPVDPDVVVSAAQVAARQSDAVALTTPDAIRDALARDPGWIASAYGVRLSARNEDGDAAAVVLFAQGHALDSDELALLGAYAHLVAQARRRVRRYEDEHEAAVALQQSLLPSTLPETPGLEVAAHYRSGAPNTTVGGDWYDVVTRPDGIVHMSVGDVAGRGIDAAISMGQLRNAFRAYALEYASPAAIVERLSRHVSDGGMATTVCATYDPCTRELAYASAGHPPPLLVDSETAVVRRLNGSNRVPLGWRSPATAQEHLTVVPPGTSVALYTDGLVERRGTDIDAGIDRLAAALATAEPVTAATLDAIVAAVAPNRADDVALLLVTFTDVPSRLELTIRADPRELRPLRRRVRAWLSQHEAAEESQHAAVLSLNEACANAIEHAYGASDGGTIAIGLTVAGDTLEIVVEDHGRWREPSATSERGRGILLMEGLMRTADVQRRRHGTRVVLEADLGRSGAAAAPSRRIPREADRTAR